jgi:hypothetical protein
MMIAAFDLNSPGMKWATIALSVATIFFVVIKPSMRKKKDPLARRPSATALSRERNVERQMQNLLVELSEMARQITAQLDTRSAKLQALIAEADEKIALLASAAPPSPRAMFDSFKPDPVPAAEPEPKAPAADVRYQQIYALADDGQTAPEIATTLDRPRGEIDLILALRARV